MLKTDQALHITTEPSWMVQHCYVLSLETLIQICFLAWLNAWFSDTGHACPENWTFSPQDKLYVICLIRSHHHDSFLTVRPLQIQNKALNPLKQSSRLSCWPPQVIQSQRLYSVHVIIACRDNISGSVTHKDTNKNLISHWKKEKQNNIKRSDCCWICLRSRSYSGVECSGRVKV